MASLEKVVRLQASLTRPVIADEGRNAQPTPFDSAEDEVVGLYPVPEVLLLPPRLLQLFFLDRC